MALEKDFRSPHSPSPIYGIRPGFTVGDFDRPYGYGTPTSTPISVYSGRSTTDSTGTSKSPKARVIKVVLTINSGSGSVDLSMKSNSDTYTAVVFDTGAISGLGTYEYYVGGWSSPTDGDAGYQATQYGPTKPGAATDDGNTEGDENVTNPDPAADSNYVGGTYNPTNFLSLAGDDVMFFATVSGTM